MHPEFLGCTVTSCVRRMTGKKTYANYSVEEQCPYAQNGNNTCTFKRHEKIERKDDGNPEPAK